MEVKPWPDNDSLDVQSLNDAFLDYDHDYNPEYHKSTDLKIMKRACNLMGNLNHCQITDYTFEMRVYGDQDSELLPNCGIRTHFTDDMDLQKIVLGFLHLPIQDPTNATKRLITEKVLAMVEATMKSHEQLQVLPVIGQQKNENILLKENRETDK